MTTKPLIWLAGAAALLTLCTGVGSAQAPAANQPPVQIMTTKFGNNFYAIDGQGGRMGALFGHWAAILATCSFF